MIDINQPVEQGDDVVINEGGDQHLGSYEEFDLKAAEGLLTGIHMDVAEAEAILEEDAPAKPKAKSIKVKQLDAPAPVDAPAKAAPEAAPAE